MTTDKPRAQRTKQADPLGKRALFSPPEDVSKPRPARTTRQGKQALYSAAPTTHGWTVTLECSKCASRSKLAIAEAAVLIMSFSLWIPGFRYSRWLRCPVCERRTWCRIHWTG